MSRIAGFVDAHLDTHGRAVICTEGGGIEPYSVGYTVGHVRRNLPEIVLYGLPVQLACTLLNDAGSMIFRDPAIAYKAIAVTDPKDCVEVDILANGYKAAFLDVTNLFIMPKHQGLLMSDNIEFDSDWGMEEHDFSPWQAMYYAQEVSAKANQFRVLGLFLQDRNFKFPWEEGAEISHPLRRLWS